MRRAPSALIDNVHYVLYVLLTGTWESFRPFLNIKFPFPRLQNVGASILGCQFRRYRFTVESDEIDLSSDRMNKSING